MGNFWTLFRAHQDHPDLQAPQEKRVNLVYLVQLELMVKRGLKVTMANQDFQGLEERRERWVYQAPLAWTDRKERRETANWTTIWFR